MKKTIYLLHFILFISFQSKAQEVKIGIKTGVNLSILSGTINRDPKYKPGAHIGGYVDIPASEVVHIQPEFYYSSQGAKVSYGIPGAIKTGETNLHLHYFNLPVIFKFYIGELFNLQLGPQVGILIGARERGTYNGLDVDENVTDSYKAFDFALAGGFGIDATENFNFGARLNYGISDIGKDNSVISSDRPSVNNRVIHLYAAFSF
jgi:hypothetical protein